MNTPYVFKRCTKCGEWLVANNINFSKNKDGKYGLFSKCKKCQAEYYKQYYEDNKDKIKQHRENNEEYQKQWRENNKEYHKQYYENNRYEILEQKNSIVRITKIR